MNLIQVIDILKEKGEITTKELHECNCSDYTIKKLMTQGLLKRVKRGIYQADSFNAWYELGNSFILTKNRDISNKIFDLCYEMDPMNLNINYHCLHSAVYNGDKEKAFQHFDVIYKILCGKVNRPEDAYYHLILLNGIFGVPDRYKKIIEMLEVNDLMKKKFPLDNKIREHVFNNNYESAVFYRNKKDKELFKWTDSHEKLFIDSANFVYKNHLHIIYELVQSDKIEELQKYLKKLSDERRLADREEVLLGLVNDYINIKNTGVIPDALSINSHNVYSLVESNNYFLARQVLEAKLAYEKRENIPFLLLMLNKIIDLVREKRREEREKEYLSIKTSSLNSQEDYTLEKAILSLKDNNMDYVKKYLESIGMKDYYFLIEGEKKLSILDGDTIIYNPELLLRKIVEGSFSLDVYSYVSLFKESILEKDYEKARIILDIVQNIKNIVNNSDLEEVLQDMFIMLNNQKKEDEQVDRKTKSFLKKRMSNLEFLVKNAYQQLYSEKKDMVLFEPMEDKQIEEIITISKNYPDLKVEVIGNDSFKRVFLRYVPYKDYIDYKLVVRDANESVHASKMNKAFDLYREILRSKKPPFYVYIQYGFALMKKGKIKEAIDYLIVGNAKDKKHCLAKMIPKLMEQLGNEEYKPNCNISFDDNMFDENIDYVNAASQLMNDYGLSFEDACQKLSLDELKVNYLKLVYARDCYYTGDIKEGDRLLQEVSKSKDKDVKVKSLLNEMYKSRRFYQYRMDDEGKVLVLKNRNSL